MLTQPLPLCMKSLLCPPAYWRLLSHYLIDVIRVLLVGEHLKSLSTMEGCEMALVKREKAWLFPTKC